MAAEQTLRAIAAQPDWLARVPADRRFPEGARLLFTGCGTSFHAAATGGEAVQALELVLRSQGAAGARSSGPGVAGSPGGASSLERGADLLVIVSHEGETPLTLEAARAWRGPRWLVTGAADGPIAELCEEVVVCTPEIEESWCHTASYTCAVAALAASNGEEIGWLPAAVAEALEAPLPSFGAQERFLVAGAGRDLPTAHEAALKLREGAWVAAEAYETEQLLHGFLAAVDESVRAFVLEGTGRAAERAQAAVEALRALGCDVDLVPTRHPVVDVVLFQRLTVALALARGREPDRIRRDDERWAAAASAAKADNAA
jgi:glutamine---fructose-6-phosphate transaminase (isomerizing)